MNTTEQTDYQAFLLARWQRLCELSPVTAWERRLLEHARFSIWLEAHRNGLSERDLANVEGQGAHHA